MTTENAEDFIRYILEQKPEGMLAIMYVAEQVRIAEKNFHYVCNDITATENEHDSLLDCLVILEEHLAILHQQEGFIDEYCKDLEYHEPYSEYDSLLPKRQAMRPKLPVWVDRGCGIRSGMWGKVSRKFKRFVLAHPQKDVNALYSKFCKKIKNTSGYENHIAKRLWAQEIKTSYKFSRGGVIHVKPYHPGSPELLAPSTKYPVYALRKKYTISYDGTYCQGVKNSVTLATDTWKYTPTWKEREYAKLYRRDVTMSDGAKFSYDYTPYKAKGKKGADKWCFDGNWNKAVKIRYWHGTEDMKKSATKKEIKKYRLNEISANFEPTVYDRGMK